MSVINTMLDLLPTLLLVGFTYWFISRQARQMTGGIGGLGGGGKGKGKNGGGGIFGIGKASVTTLDKSAKDKVCSVFWHFLQYEMVAKSSCKR